MLLIPFWAGQIYLKIGSIVAIIEDNFAKIEIKRSS